MSFNSIENINPVRLKKARISRGYSLADLADRIGVTKQYISQCELGITNASNIIYKLCDVLNYPISFFSKSTKGIETASATYFRSRKSTPKKLKEAANEKVDLFSEIKDFFGEYINYPELNLPDNIELKDEYTIEDLEKVAKNVREYWKLGMGPIDDLVSVLQENGIIISKIKVGNNKIDAFSKWINSVPYVFLSIDKDSAVRSRFDIAHELCHILLHQYISKEDIECKEKLNQIEKEADAFAGAFLLPAETFSREVFSSSLDNLVRLKERWKVSISCMINRCSTLGLFTDNQVAYLKKQMTYKNYWRREPLDDTIQCEIPYLYKQILELLLENNILSKNDIVEKIAMNPEEIEEYCYLNAGILCENKSGKIISMRDFR